MTLPYISVLLGLLVLILVAWFVWKIVKLVILLIILAIIVAALWYIAPFEDIFSVIPQLSGII